MRSMPAWCVNSVWFLGAVLCLFPLAGAAVGYFVAQHFNPIALIVIFTLIGLVCSRLAFGTPEMIVAVILGMVFSAIWCSPMPSLSVAIAGFVAAIFFAFAVLEWMDKANRSEAAHQAQIEPHD